MKSRRSISPSCGGGGPRVSKKGNLHRLIPTSHDLFGIAKQRLSDLAAAQTDVLDLRVVIKSGVGGRNLIRRSGPCKKRVEAESVFIVLLATALRAACSHYRCDAVG